MAAGAVLSPRGRTHRRALHLVRQARRTARRSCLLARHGWLLQHGHVLRWRLETYGLYMPSLPQRRPWWRVNGAMLVALLRHRRQYAGWLEQMQALAQGGPGAWWQTELGERYRTLHGYVDQENGNWGDAETAVVSGAPPHKA